MRVKSLETPSNRCPCCDATVARDFSRVVQVCPSCGREFKYVRTGKHAVVTIAFPKEVK